MYHKKNPKKSSWLKIILTKLKNMSLFKNRDKPFRNLRKKVSLSKIRIKMMRNLNTMKKNIILKMTINEI
jgi:hypothetical protein